MLITLISLLIVGWYASGSMRNFHYGQVSADLESNAHIIDDKALDLVNASDLDQLQTWSTQTGISEQRRITIIGTDGKVLADSEKEIKSMDNHADRPEIITALTGHTGTETRFSQTFNQNLMYVAIPLKDENGIIAVLRIARSVSYIDSQLQAVHTSIFLAGLVVAIFAAAISLIVSRKISKPLVELRSGAKSFTNGNLDQKLPLSGCKEIASVTKAMNTMAADINQRIQTISLQRNEHHAVLSSMTEAVLALDRDQKLITLNSAAENILGLEVTKASGRDLRELVRSPALQQFVNNALAANDPLEESIVFHANKMEYLLRAKSGPLKDQQDRVIGVLIVLDDITRLKKLEKVRRDFVANVSHELKTPITSIKGFVETLLSGAMNDPDDAKRFLEIIAKQSDRLDAIIDDLLRLSKIEQHSEKADIELCDTCLKDVINAAVQLCQNTADVKKVSLIIDCDDNLAANINEPLLEQAIVNLLDNAVKYSDQDSTVEITANTSDDHVNIVVTDHGCGIEQVYLPRLFERFYRVDKARSRKLGGTGLGLAITKHIVQLHKGSINVASQVGSGTTFTIILPIS